MDNGTWSKTISFCVLLLAIAIARPAFGQSKPYPNDFSGHYVPLFHEDEPDRGPGPAKKSLQRFLAVLPPARGQKVIEENVGDHARVVAVLGNQHAAEGGHAGMRIREGIDAAVLADAVPNPGSESIAQSAFHEIAGEVTDQRFGRITGQEEMSEIVHARQR